RGGGGAAGGGGDRKRAAPAGGGDGRFMTAEMGTSENVPSGVAPAILPAQSGSCSSGRLSQSSSMPSPHFCSVAAARWQNVAEAPFRLSQSTKLMTKPLEEWTKSSPSGTSANKIVRK
ncbi:hypothetical protein Vafri_11230, partial [Volvox africanus]